jgi:hypothetical protein
MDYKFEARYIATTTLTIRSCSTGIRWRAQRERQEPQNRLDHLLTQAHLGLRGI